MGVHSTGPFRRARVRPPPGHNDMAQTEGLAHLLTQARGPGAHRASMSISRREGYSPTKDECSDG